MTKYDALLIVSFGGPEGPDDVIPFLENVLRGRNVPRERMLQVAHHYDLFGGVSPINLQNRALIQALRDEFAATGFNLPIYWGNRNWIPYLTDTLRQMCDDGIHHALAFLTSAYSSYSGCRQYREDIAKAQEAVGEGAPSVDILRKFYNHPGFVEPNIDNIMAAFAKLPEDRRANARLVFTAHSIPVGMAQNSQYEAQLAETCKLVAAGLNRPDWHLIYQSRSGSPAQPWLGPDILEYLDSLPAEGVEDVIVAPIGFISDHMEIMYDLDTEAQQRAHALGVNMIRAATVGADPRFVQMIHALIVERMTDDSHRIALGTRGPSHDVCPLDCCLMGAGRPASTTSA
jgi:ferrochelatase